MTNREACEPCSKRKVRCDKREPCSNCRRRKTDRCVYPTISPNDRIRKLEALIRRLGGDPNDSNVRATGSQSTITSPASTQAGFATDQSSHQDDPPVNVRGKDPVVLQEDGQSCYYETRAWQGWLGADDNHNTPHDRPFANPFLLHSRPHAFSRIAERSNHQALVARHPSPEHATALWYAFLHRVEPLVRIMYRSSLAQLRLKSIDPDNRQHLSGPENALVSAVYLLGASSLFEDECENTLHQTRPQVLSQYHTLCEDSLLEMSIFCMTDILAIKAVVYFIMATYDRLSTQSLWSLMGLALRNAEKAGIHRDGALLGLSPAEAEDRRRTWWQLQHVDLLLGVRSGMTPMTLMADWDAKIPSNIEDDDINPTMTTMPKERKGLTSMSYCRYTYWILDHQRQIFHAKQGRFALSWQSNTGLSMDFRDSIIDQLEDGINREFLQYCDPLNSLDTLLQLLARFLIVGMKMRILHSAITSEDTEENKKTHTALLNASMQGLKYNIALHSQPSLKQYQWYTKAAFPWHAFMCVLVEACREAENSRAQETWDLIASVYDANLTLFELSEDRRKHHAAGLLVAAWRAKQNKFPPSLQPTTPSFVASLEARLAPHRARVSGEAIAGVGTLDQQVAQNRFAPVTPDSLMTEEDLNGTFELDFQDIDWSFWSSME